MKSITKFVILGLLTEKPMSGYDIRKRVKTRMSSFWDISYGQIYPSLSELEKSENITKKIEINENRPNRKVYSITNKGIKKLQSWLLLPAEPATVKIETMLKVAFGNNIPKEELLKHIKEFKKRAISNIKKVNSIEKEAKNQLDKHDRAFFVLLTISLGKYLQNAAISWADSAIKQIEHHKKN